MIQIRSTNNKKGECSWFHDLCSNIIKTAKISVKCGRFFNNTKC